jgi:SpoVK/Ycf46/Vps4 family AAA+-type ATPase
MCAMLGCAHCCACRCVTLLLAAVQVQVEVPDVQGRWDILKVHAKNKKLADDVNLESVAMRVPGKFVRLDAHLKV